MTTPPNPMDRPRRRSAVESVFLAPEVVVWDSYRQRPHHFNPSASAVWMCLDGELTPEEIAAELGEVFQTPPDAILADVHDAIEQFAGLHLLETAHDHDPQSDLVGGSLPILPPPPECQTCGGGTPTVWAGTIDVEAGGYRVAVGYDSDATAAALRVRCAAWSSAEPTGVEPAFGVSAAKVGLRRRQVGVVHHGTAIRHRLESVEAAVEVVGSFLDELSVERPEHQVAVESRVVIRDGRVALLVIPPSTDLDDRPLRRVGISELPTIRPLLDPATGTLTIAGTDHRLERVVVAPAESLDDARRQVFVRGDGPWLQWAEYIDRLGEKLVWRHDASDLTALLDEALSGETPSSPE